MWYNRHMTAAPSIGRTLARLAALSPRRIAGGDTTTDSRAHILQLIDQEQSPVSVEWLCAQTDLHPNTVRGHLEVLVASGDVLRESGRSTGRGRPPMLYRAGEASVLYRELAATLVEQLGDATDPALITEAAGRWAEAVEHEAPAHSVDEAVEQAAHALDQLGFSAEISPVGDSITLGSCPYAALIREQPVICDIHTALLRDLLDRTGQQVEVGDMQVWAAPGMCRAQLNRADRTPARVIPGNPAARRGSNKDSSGRKRKTT